MCGFAGVVAHRQPEPEARRRAVLQAMGSRMAARGPDEETHVVDGRLSVVFRRLAIIDLDTGSQPIWNEDRTAFVVANGEIFNHRELRARLEDRHRFRTASDSEVILHLYEEMGPRCVALLNGIFAFAVWDTREQTLFLARDRLGVKPLYYAADDARFLFGSELKALLMHPSAPRMPNLLTWKSVDESTVLGIHSLPGGHHALLSRDGTFRVEAYWSLAAAIDGAAGEARPAGDYVEAYAALVEDAVRKQLMSDVPLGVALSGGLDSSIITAIAAKVNRDLRCFTIFEDADEGGDRRAAETLARLEQVQHYQVSLEAQGILSRKLTLTDLEYLVWTLDGPYGNPETWSKLLAYHAAKTAAPDMKVMLLGQGADEFTGGYTRQATIANGAWGYAHESWDDFLARHTFFNVPPPFRALVTGGFALDEGQVYASYVRGAAEYLQKYNLWHEDRTTASQGLEARVPFLDHRLVELLVSVPASLHRTLFWDKEIERRAAERWLPRELARRHKIGFIKTTAANVSRAVTESLVAFFPDFDAKYLAPPDAVVSREKLTAIVRQLAERPSDDMADLLFLTMQFSIFAAQCRSPRDYDHLLRWTPGQRP